MFKSLVERALGWVWRMIGQAGHATRMSPAQAYRAVQDGEAILVDVRERQELLGGLAEPARWMPTSGFRQQGRAWHQFVSDLPREKLIVLYCGAGVRAGQIADALTAEGFRTANAGGFGEWVRAGLPTRQVDPSALQAEAAGRATS